jgi:hypothetical protein
LSKSLEEANMPLDINYSECLLKGLIGGIGAMPGTCGSHPFDVVKIRMQTQGDKLGDAARVIFNHNNNPGLKNFYRGFRPAIEQRLITRGPMFLVSELYTQAVEQNTGWSRTTSTFIGSCGSGFTTGALAGIAEYRKKLLSQSVVTQEEARWLNLYKTAKKHGLMSHLGRRLFTAGCCSATYDSFFFGTEVSLRQRDYIPAMSYGCAAVTATCAAFAFDSVVARMMVIPPQEKCPTFSQTLKALFAPKEGMVNTIPVRVFRGYRGLSARGCEFFINYSITGATSVYVTMAFVAIMGTKA